MWPNPQQMSFSSKQPQQKWIMLFGTFFFYNTVMSLEYSTFNPPSLPLCLYSGHLFLHNSSFIKQHHTSGKGWGKDSAETYRKRLHREGFAAVLNSCVRSCYAVVQCTYCNCQVKNLVSPWSSLQEFRKFCRICVSSRGESDGVCNHSPTLFTVKILLCLWKFSWLTCWDMLGFMAFVTSSLREREKVIKSK